MNAYFAAATLLMASAVLLALPLIPAIRELQHRSDALPLGIIQQHAGEIRYFADSFRSYVRPLDPALRECVSTGRNASGILADGTGYIVLANGNDALSLPLQNGHCPVLIVSATDLVLTSFAAFDKDIYSLAGLVGGENNRYRALLADGDTYLGKQSSLLRWAHASGRFSAAPGCKLEARVSSDSGIQLAGGCSFLRLNAPRIDFGQPLDRSASPTTDAPVPAILNRILHDGDFEIHPGETFHDNLVVRGKLRIGSGARVYGSVKSEDDLCLNPGAQVLGSLITEKNLVIGANCRVHGPVIAEREASIESGTQCGEPQRLTTVSALTIKIAESVAVFGSVWAREHGEVVNSL